MPVTIDSASAVRLAAEGAICLDADTSTATRNGLPVPWPPGQAEYAGPLLVRGSSDGTVRAAAERLERSGLAAWQVLAEEEPP